MNSATTKGTTHDWCGRLVLGLFAALLMWPGASKAESPRQVVKEGNAAYAAGNFEGALKAYERAAAANPQSAQIEFNKGDALFQQGDYTNAARAFEQADQKTRDPLLKSRIAYNLGNCAFTEAERRRTNDLATAMAACERSIGHYQQALALNRQSKETAENIEIARCYLQMLRQEEERKRREREEQAKGGRPQQGGAQNRQPATASSAASQGQQGATAQSTQTNPSANAQQQTKQSPGSASASAQSQAAATGSSRGSSSAQAGGSMGQMGAGDMSQRITEMQKWFEEQHAQFAQQAAAMQSRFGTGGANSRTQAHPSGPLSDQPEDILKEEREQQARWLRIRPRTNESTVEKDW
jgi:Ca-activated chloride channel homolog